MAVAACVSFHIALPFKFVFDRNFTSSDVSALTDFECKLVFFVGVDALVRSSNMITCHFASLKLYGNLLVHILHGGFVFPTRLSFKLLILHR